MDSHDQVPVLILHVFETDIPQDTGVVEQYIDATIVLDGCLDDLVTVCDAVVVGYCFAACGFDLVDDNISGLCFDTLISNCSTLVRETGEGTFVDVPSPLKDPPRSLTTTLAPLEPKNSAYASQMS
jgi:hypothetical protein